MAKMTEREMCQMCARAMGYKIDFAFTDHVVIFDERKSTYNPLEDDSQLMALVEAFEIGIEPDYVVLVHQDWGDKPGLVTVTTCAFEKRSGIAKAIVTCVAKSQKAKEAAGLT